MAAKYLSFPVATIVDSGTETIIITGNNVTAQTATSMTDTTVNFVTLGVQVGDRVTDTANSDTALVTAVTATVLTIDTNIFTAALETYSITALGSSLYYGAGSGNDIITIQHTDQGNGSLVAEAIQTAMQDAVSMPGSIPKPSSQNVPIGLNGTSRVLINDISIA